MKKVKIMLLAVTVFAAVGGALAFKAQKYSSTLYCTSKSPDEGGICNQLKQSFSITWTEINQEPVGLSTCTDVPSGAGCKQRLTYIDL